MSENPSRSACVNAMQTSSTVSDDGSRPDPDAERTLANTSKKAETTEATTRGTKKGTTATTTNAAPQDSSSQSSTAAKSSTLQMTTHVADVSKAVSTTALLEEDKVAKDEPFLKTLAAQYSFSSYTIEPMAQLSLAIFSICLLFMVVTCTMIISSCSMGTCSRNDTSSSAAARAITIVTNANQGIPLPTKMHLPDYFSRMRFLRRYTEDDA